MKRFGSTLAILLGVALLYLGVVGQYVVPKIYLFDVKIDVSGVSDAPRSEDIARIVAGLEEGSELVKFLDKDYITAVSDELVGYLALNAELSLARVAVEDVQGKLGALEEGADSSDLDAALDAAKAEADAASERLAAAKAAIAGDIGLARLQARNHLKLASLSERLDNAVYQSRLQFLIVGGALLLIGIVLKIALRDWRGISARRARYAGSGGFAVRTSRDRSLGWQKLLAPAALVILYIFFSIFGKNFFDSYTFKTILESSYSVGIMAFGVSFVIMTGGIDLSIGTNMMCAALIGGYAFGTWGWPLWLALLLVPLLGLAFGVGNGLMIAKLKLPPFIATLGTMLVTQGFGSIITSVQTQRYPTIGTANEWFKSVFYRAGWFPVGAVYLGLAFLVALFLMTKTKFGRYTLAIGSNEEAARLSGVKTDNWKILVYAACGLFAGIAGVFYASTYTTITPGTGNGRELDAIAAVVIGGTSMSGGSGSMVGTLIGVFIMSVLKAGLSSLGLQSQWQTFFTGFVVIGAVLLDILRVNAARRVRHMDSNPAGDRTNK